MGNVAKEPGRMQGNAADQVVGGGPFPAFDDGLGIQIDG